jgi:cell fate (sporulation/competence/biofilm development) regulator YlbF (YheA/YmcA/DUF963 family)
MSVTVDHRPLPADKLGFQTVGQVLSHLQKENRLVVHLLIDGEEPDLSRITSLRQKPLAAHTVFIETAEPRAMAAEVLDQVAEQLAEAERLKNEAAELLQAGNNVKAMERLSGCFTTWQHAQESVVKTAQLMRIDLEQVQVEGRPLTQQLTDFTEQLRSIRSALENRDFVLLTDLLVYETTETTRSWHAAIGSMREIISQMA